MTQPAPVPPIRRLLPVWLTVAALSVAGATWFFARGAVEDDPREAILREVQSPEMTASVRAACGACHVFPEPDILPAEYWITSVRNMYQVASLRGVQMPLPPEKTLAWYLYHARAELPEAEGRTDAGPGGLSWVGSSWRPEATAASDAPAVTHVEIAALFGQSASDVIVSDVATNLVYALRSAEAGMDAVALGEVVNPGRVSVADVDSDGIRDVVVAELGDLVPTNDPVGSVVLLRGTGTGTFEATRIATGLGRVGDVHASDVDGDGRTDVVVAVFGWLEEGRLVLLRNTTQPGEALSFETETLDPRSGFTDARAVDLDGDGYTDVVALLAQEFQQVVAYWGGPDGFRSEVLFAAPNPDWGFTGMEVVDFTGNGRPDVIVANGDNLDLTFAKPQHGVAMLENHGGRAWTYRHLTSMYGVHRAVPADVDADGRLDLVLAAYLPPRVAEAAPAPAEAVVWLQRVGPTQLVRRVLKREGLHHMTLDAGDIQGGGAAEIVLGWIDLGVVDPGQAAPAGAIDAFVTILSNSASGSDPGGPPPVIDWAGTGS